MRCLWITAADPTPENNGQYIYSGRLIDAVSAAGARVDVLCLGREGSSRSDGIQDGNVRWWLAAGSLGRTPRCFVSDLPNVAFRTCSSDMRQRLRALLDRGAWDCIVLDGISVGWAIRPIRRRHPRGGLAPRVIYVSHNHEESVRELLARHQANPVLRSLFHLDAAKVRRLERSVVDGADIVTAITPDDAARYGGRRPDLPVVTLSPGYHGAAAERREITSAQPRRAVLIGSFDWIAKQMNLSEFIAVADPIFAAAGVELEVVGNGDPHFIRRMRRSVTATTFTGSVPSLQSHIDKARMALVPERTGGGFKLKVLDYVFNRLPIAALSDSVAGVPLLDNKSILFFGDYRSLALGVRDVIDDLALLNRLHEAAFSACKGRFEWSSRGKLLLEAMGRP